MLFTNCIILKIGLILNANKGLIYFIEELYAAEQWYDVEEWCAVLVVFKQDVFKGCIACSVWVVYGWFQII